MTGRDAPYAPGWGAEVMSMVSARTAQDRAAFALPFLSDGTRLLDVGCGPGSITLGLARAVERGGSVVGIDMHPSQVHAATRAGADEGVVNAVFQVGNAYELPFEPGSFDVVFAHALFEHLVAPSRALAEMARVLRPQGLLAASSSDWSGARIAPLTPDARCAMDAHFALRRRAGGDPFGGSQLPSLVSAAGFEVVKVGADDKIDMSYAELAAYVAARVREAYAQTGDPALEEACAAASRWASSETKGVALQRWVHVVARCTKR